MSDADDLYEWVYPHPHTLDYLKLVFLTAGITTITCLASWAAATAVGAPVLLAPLVPTATFVALLDRADLPAAPQRGRSRSFLAAVAALLYVAGTVNAGA